MSIRYYRITSIWEQIRQLVLSSRDKHNPVNTFKLQLITFLQKMKHVFFTPFFLDI